MFFKGIIRQVKQNNKFVVEIPTLTTAGADPYIVDDVPLCYQPGNLASYAVDDIVFVQFEFNGDTSFPVIMGKLYLGIENEKDNVNRGSVGYVYSNTLEITEKASLPGSTTIAGVNMMDVIKKVRSIDNEAELTNKAIVASAITNPALMSSAKIVITPSLTSASGKVYDSTNTNIGDTIYVSDTTSVNARFVQSTTAAGTLLPADYQELEFLEGDGTAYINTGYMAGSDSSYEVDFQVVERGPVHGIIGCYHNNLRFEFLMRNDANYSFEPGFYTEAYTTGPASDLFRHKIKQQKNLCYFDDVLLYTFATTEFRQAQPCLLFNFYYSTGPGTASKVRIYSAKLLENGINVRHFIPCYRKSDGVNGMYDVVGNTFYPNAASSGSFIRGPEVKSLPTAYQEVEYIKSDGTAYIDTGFKPNQNTEAQITMRVTEDIAYKYMLGSWLGTSIDFRGFAFYRGSGAYWWDYADNDTVLQNVGTTKLTVSMNKNTLSYIRDNISIYKNSVASATFTCTENFLLFTIGYNGGHYGQVENLEIYKFQLWDNNSLIRNMIPCYRKADDVYGMYDLVNGVFYTNAEASGSLIGGPEIPVEYNLQLIAVQGA